MTLMTAMLTGTPRIDWVISCFLLAVADSCSLALSISVSVLFRDRSG